MFSPHRRHLIIALLTSAALPLLAQVCLAFYSFLEQLLQVKVGSSLSSPSPNSLLKTVVVTCIAIAIPSYLIAFYSQDLYHAIKESMTSYFSNPSSALRPSQGAPATRSMFNRRRYRAVDDETYNKLMKRGGNIGGLVNDGNTCFMNSVIQSLASSNTLLALLEDESIQDAVETKELRFMKALKTLLNKVNAKHLQRGRDYKTNPMLKTMSKAPNKNFLLGYNQEDAQEFFQTILSELESDLKKLYKEDEKEGSPETGASTPSSSSSSKNGPFYIKDIPENSIFGNHDLGHLGDVFVPASQIDPNLEDANDKVFKYNLLTPVDGLSAERIGCLRCGEMGGIRYSVISGLSLNLPAERCAQIELTTLLDKWTEPEIIEGVDCNRCALIHALEFQETKLEEVKNGEKTSSSEFLIKKLTERVDEIKHELSKPIIDDDVVKKLFTSNMMQKTSKSKQILISRPPPLLAMHINRSVFDPETFRVRKNGANVIFPLKLDLDPYVAEPEEINTDARLPLSKKAKIPSEDVEMEDDKSQTASQIDETETVDPFGDAAQVEETGGQDHLDEEAVDDSESMTPSLESDEAEPASPKSPSFQPMEDSDDEDEDDSPDDEPMVQVGKPIATRVEKQDISGPLVYQLRSVIVHYGTHNYGHYIAFRKYRGVWWRTSDENVDIVDEDEVLSTPGVFMLFYELDSKCQELAKDEEEMVMETQVSVGSEVDSSAVESTQEDKPESEDEVQQQEMVAEQAYSTALP